MLLIAVLTPSKASCMEDRTDTASWYFKEYRIT